MSKRRVWLEITCRIVREYPADWTDEQVEFHCNESSSCFDNLLRDRLEQSGGPDGECTCFAGEARVIPGPSGPGSEN